MGNRNTERLNYRRSWRGLPAATLTMIILLMTGQPSHGAEGGFLFLESIESKGRPESLEAYGLKHLPVVDPRKDLSFEGDNKKNMVLEKSIDEVARSLHGEEMVCIDIESWPTCNSCISRWRSRMRYSRVLEWFREANPDAKLGFWGRPPKHAYFRAIEPKDSEGYRDWQQHNDFYRPLAEEVDVIFPSLYARYNDVEGWIRHAEANLEEARQYGKPVYAYITPYYIKSDEPYSKTPLEPEFWRKQLETVYKHADGLVIWTGPLKQWDEDAPWWKITKEFLASKGAMQE